MLQDLYDQQPADDRRAPAELKAILRDQRDLLKLDEKRALSGLSKLLPRSTSERSTLWKLVQQLALASGALSPEGTKSLARIEKIFAAKGRSKAVTAAEAQ